MEKKQLNFSAPLLSVRRISSPRATSYRDDQTMKRMLPPSRQQSLPAYRSNSKHDQDSKPGTVPFVWEQTPGRPKGHSGPLPAPGRDISTTPRLPPGRFSDAAQQNLDKDYEDRFALTHGKEALYRNDSVTIWESLKERINENGESDVETDDDDAYSDALDMLSPVESSSWSCSVSGLSGSDGPDVKPSGTFSLDAQTRDIMMNRFLPAAKAMAIEAPQYASRKQPAVSEVPRIELSRKVERYADSNRPSLNRYGTNTLPDYYQGVEEEVSEDENDRYDVTRNNIFKACGLVSRFSLKNSLSLLNPVPGDKAKDRTSKASDLRNIYANKSWKANYKQKLDRTKSLEPYGLEHKLTSKFNQLSYRREFLDTNLSLPHRHSRDGGISPYRNHAPQSPFNAKGFLGVPKKVESFSDRRGMYAEETDTEEAIYLQKDKSGSDSGSPVAERTLYIDSINVVEDRHSFSSSSDTKWLTYPTNEDFNKLDDSKGIKEKIISELSVGNVECPNAAKEGVLLKRDAPMPLESHLSSTKNFSHRGPMGSLMAQKNQQILERPDSKYSGKPLTSNQQLRGAEDQENSSLEPPISPLPLPLPKSPSESWLWRALPSISSKKSFSRSHTGSQSRLGRKISKTPPPTAIKWETIVKTSNKHKDHVRYSEELTLHVSQQSKF